MVLFLFPFPNDSVVALLSASTHDELSIYILRVPIVGHFWSKEGGGGSTSEDDSGVSGRGVVKAILSTPPRGSNPYIPVGVFMSRSTVAATRWFTARSAVARCPGAVNDA